MDATESLLAITESCPYVTGDLRIGLPDWQATSRLTPGECSNRQAAIRASLCKPLLCPAEVRQAYAKPPLVAVRQPPTRPGDQRLPARPLELRGPRRRFTTADFDGRRPDAELFAGANRMAVEEVRRLTRRTTRQWYRGLTEAIREPARPLRSGPHGRPFLVLDHVRRPGHADAIATPKVLHAVCSDVEWIIGCREGRRGGEGGLRGPAGGRCCSLPLSDPAEAVEHSEGGEGTAAASRLGRRPRAAQAGDPVRRSRSSRRTRSPGSTGSTPRRRPPPSSSPRSSIRAGTGRIVRDPEGRFERIVETKYTEGLAPSCSGSARSTSARTCSSAQELYAALDRVGLEDGELYLTGAFPVIAAQGGGGHARHRGSGHRARRKRPRRPDARRGRGPAPHPRGARLAGVTFLQPASTRVRPRSRSAKTARSAPA